MSYLALARKWRPRTFSQLVGQEHITKALINSLNQQRLHHAYLFTGTRGVGKTSVARLLAKALNCEQGVSATPCLQCETCLAVEQGRFMDLIEIDGASRTRVEDTRELLENVQYSPTSGRFKIYLIDEVHMLSQHSFNALLKTLEEPPAHVKFLLATTDPQKLPVTVLSRCLQFSLKHLEADLIAEHLQSIMQVEQLPFEPDALALLAKAAKGSMRDALSLLDQAIASVNNFLGASEVKAILGYTQQDYALQMLQALANLDASLLIQLSRQIAQEGGHFRYVLEEILDYLHQMAVIQNIGGENPLLRSCQEVKNLAGLFSPEDIQLFYQIGLKGGEEIHLAPSLAIGFEMTLLRMLAFKPAAKVARPPLAHKTEQPQVKNPLPMASEPRLQDQRPEVTAHLAIENKSVLVNSSQQSIPIQPVAIKPSIEQAKVQTATIEQEPAPNLKPDGLESSTTKQTGLATSFQVDAAELTRSFEPLESILVCKDLKAEPREDDPLAESMPQELGLRRQSEALATRAEDEILGFVAQQEPSLDPKLEQEDFKIIQSEEDFGLSIMQEDFHLTPGQEDVNTGWQVEDLTPRVSNIAASLTPVEQSAQANHNPENWASILSQLKLTGLALNAVENAELVSKNGRELTLRVSKGHQSLFTPSITARIEQALESYYKESIKIALISDEGVQSTPAQQKQTARNIRQQEAEQSLESDPFFQQLRQEFGAEVVKNSIVPVKDGL